MVWGWAGWCASRGSSTQWPTPSGGWCMSGCSDSRLGGCRGYVGARAAGGCEAGLCCAVMLCVALGCWFTGVMVELSGCFMLTFPLHLVQMALAVLKRSVKKRAGFSVDRVAPLDCVGSSFIPALFGERVQGAVAVQSACRLMPLPVV